MAGKTDEPPVRMIGSRELHQNLPTILRELEQPSVRYVLTVHGKPRARDDRRGAIPGADQETKGPERRTRGPSVECACWAET